MDKLVDYCLVKIYAVIRVKETNQFWSQEDDFVLSKPKLKVEPVGGQLHAGRLGRIRLSFVNPLEVELRGCSITLEAPGISEIRERVGNVRWRSSFTHDVLVTPRRAGKTTAVACFSSEAMIDVHGSVKLDILQ